MASTSCSHWSRMFAPPPWPIFWRTRGRGREDLAPQCAGRAYAYRKRECPVGACACAEVGSPEPSRGNAACFSATASGGPAVACCGERYHLHTAVRPIEGCAPAHRERTAPRVEALSQRRQALRAREIRRGVAC